jgi:hypothetical protein
MALALHFQTMAAVVTSGAPNVGAWKVSNRVPAEARRAHSCGPTVLSDSRFLEPGSLLRLAGCRMVSPYRAYVEVPLARRCAASDIATGRYP